MFGLHPRLIHMLKLQFLTDEIAIVGRVERCFPSPWLG